MMPTGPEIDMFMKAMPIRLGVQITGGAMLVFAGGLLMIYGVLEFLVYLRGTHA